MDDNKKNQNIELAFDVGHSSIGWSVLKLTGASDKEVELRGCGTVIFRADDCLASSRRAFRRQRRHIRSTRQRIARMKLLIEQVGGMTRNELDKPGCAWPWKMAAQVLNSKSGSNKNLLLSWAELWDVLRWYAHNRGYDGNKRWSAGEEEKEDTEKVENANALMQKFSASSMAETFCAVSGIDPLGKKRSCNVSPADRIKARNAAFPREVVESEVRRILRMHTGVLQGVDGKFERVLCDDWKVIPCERIKLPKRYQGGLLFGQLVPRFDNRIISMCPVSGEKVPSKNTREFLDFRWGMQLANIRTGSGAGELKALSPEVRKQVDLLIRAKGSFTEKELKDAVRKATGCRRDNLDTMLMHPDAKKALIVDPVQVALRKGRFDDLFCKVSERVQKRTRGKLWNGKAISLGELRTWQEGLGFSTAGFDAELERQIQKENTRKKHQDKAVDREEVLKERTFATKLSGRAAYSRKVMLQAVGEVMAGKHPKEPGGCLYITEDMRHRELNRKLDEQTNNHLIRHRLLILQRLLKDIVKEYADGNKERVKQVTIEVNRDLREFSGKTAKQIKQDLGLRLSNHSHVAAELEKAFAEEKVKITAGLIRKARIAADLGWICPYTGKQFEPMDLVQRSVDKDHIIPRSLRASDSLESLVLTYSAVNRFKKQRTALQFIQEEGGKPVPDMPNLSLMTLQQYQKFVDKLESYKGHEEDKRRKEKRKKLLLLASYEEKEFTPKDLTTTSQLVRLGAQAIKRLFQECKTPPTVISLPGSVTGSVRKSWNVLGCLSQANPQVMDADGKVKSKTEIRDITHLHHALDACVLGFAAHFIPNNGRIWELLVKRRLSAGEIEELKRVRVIQFLEDGKFDIRDLREEYKAEIRQRLAEKRVVQHVPARMTGLRAEQNTWRVVEQKEDGEVTLCQYRRGADGKREEVLSTEKAVKILGLNPEGERGKLKALKGALIIPDNYGVALDPTPTIIPYHKVPVRLRDIREANGGKPVRVIRNGQVLNVPKGKHNGCWRIFSIKNNANGVAFALGQRDAIRPDKAKQNVLVRQLLKDGAVFLKIPLPGIACPTTSSA